jgi:hypothetical protein
MMASAIVIHALWIVAYWVAIQIKPRICAPFTWYGILVAPFMAETPMCQALFWIEATARGVFRAMWILLGTTIATFVMARLPAKE